MNRLSTVPSANYCKIERENTLPNRVVCLFMTGFCLGMVFFYLSDKAFAKESGLLDYAQISQLQKFDANMEGLLQYVTMQRLRQFVLLMLCAVCSLRSILLQGLIGFGGFEFGILMFTAAYQYGVAGLVFSMLLFFPHGIFYLMLISKIYHIFGMSDTKYYHKISRIKQIQEILMVLSFLGLGILCETYLNPFIIQKAALWL